jgi:hypothetical protein
MRDVEIDVPHLLIKIGSTMNSMKAGTPAGMQLERGVKAILPASTASLLFLIRSFAHGFRFGSLRSAIRKVACRRGLLGT